MGAAHFEWGMAGARAAPADGVLVVVDVLSFTTAVGVAVERGIAVRPAPPGFDEPGAAVAVGRREVTPERPWSLSPAGLRAAPAVDRLVLPSPNGSAIAAAAVQPVVLAASLRNARATGRWLREQAGGAVVTVVAAGERWPDGSLRPALEDLLGAGAVLAALGGAGESPDAAAARAAYEGAASVADAVRRCASGIELIAGGFAEDVEVAVELDAGEVVPVLARGTFIAG